jgi:hypothetical protein
MKKAWLRQPSFLFGPRYELQQAVIVFNDLGFVDVL